MEEISGFILYLNGVPTAVFIGGAVSLICLESFLSLTKGDKPFIIRSVEDIQEFFTSREIWRRKE
jgi:hypothetical protein